MYIDAAQFRKMLERRFSCYYNLTVFCRRVLKQMKRWVVVGIGGLDLKKFLFRVFQTHKSLSK